MHMRATVSAVLVAILTVPGSLKAAGGEAAVSFRASVEATARAFAISQSAADAAANAAWSRLAILDSATHITIRTKDGQVVHATFVDVDNISLTALTGRLPRSFARADIAEVTSDAKGSRVGAYVGASLGIVIGLWMAAGIGLGCDSRCSGGAITGEWLALVGPPVGLGPFGYHLVPASPGGMGSYTVRITHP
jgi:hypothetical protein